MYKYTSELRADELGYPDIPFHVELQTKPIQLKLFWHNIDKNGAFLHVHSRAL
jgi:hypothetical protein